MHHDHLDPELSAALMRLERSFEALAQTRSTVGRTLDDALDRITRQMTALDEELTVQAANANAAPGSVPERDAA